MSPKTPRDVSGKALIKVLSKYGYEVVRQSGSHIRLSINTHDEIKNLTIPNHAPIKLGTLMAILMKCQHNSTLIETNLLISCNTRMSP
ncbi:type II toxin-antitoxin system HicA family toxin [Mucilaginibacter sp. RCC_168]|uniref:type II toxin-antitoxin system HicA family toxin n=1 Tax=Mucilaginibacter sp. RCC_168 TaxID=3239221 RepID=UPI0035232DF7